MELCRFDSTNQKEKQKMPAVWFLLKKSLDCKSESTYVYSPKSKSLNSKITKHGRCSCSRSISNLRDVVNGSRKGHSDKPPICSPRSISSSEFTNPITHEVVFGNSTCEIKIMGIGCRGSGNNNHNNITMTISGGGGGATFVGTLRPGTPGRRGQNMVPGHHNSYKLSTKTENEGSIYFEGGGSGVLQKAREFESPRGHGTVSSAFMCQKCGEQFKKLDAVEAHHLAKHAVTELTEGDSSRKIVEIICQTSWLKPENNSLRIQKVLKVHNMHRTIASFEEYREMVKIRASKLSKKHPRCLADGNELLRFYGTTVACALGTDSSGLCASDKCGVCKILRHDFPSKEEWNGNIGIFTTSTGIRAFESTKLDGDDLWIRKALVVCRVIAGRVHKPVENLQDMAIQPGFDSVAEKIGRYSNIEELYLLSPKALLPCFVVICKS